MAFTVPFGQVSEFLKAAQEIPDPSADEEEVEQKKWIMRAARGPVYGSSRALKLWLTDAWSSFVDLIKVHLAVFLRIPCVFELPTDVS